jgi:hypothetical protein
MQLLAGISARVAQFKDGDMHADMPLCSLESLLPGRHINDEIMNARIKQLNQCHTSLLQQGYAGLKVACLPTWFMSKLLEGVPAGSINYTAAAVFTSPHRLPSWECQLGTVLNSDLVVAPTFIPGATLQAVGHWIVTLADLNARQIITLDPMLVSVL